MDGGVVLREENQNAKGDKMKGEKMAKGSKVVENIMPRKKLSDISNLSHKNQDIRPPSDSRHNTKEYIRKLHQENLTLVKLLADRKKVIQLQALDLQKLRTQCQQVQEKNLELAQSNSHMVAKRKSNKEMIEVLQHELGCKKGLLKAMQLEIEELKSNKERLTVLQHELGCKNDLLKAMQLEFEVKENMVRCQSHGNEVETIGVGEVGKFSPANYRDNVHCNKGRKRQSQSLDPTSVKPVQTKEKIFKRRLKAEEQDLSDLTFDKTDTLDPPADKPVEAEKKVNEKRLCSRKQSTTSKDAEQETANDSFVKPVQTEEEIFKSRLKAEDPSDLTFEKTDALDPPADKPVEAEKKVNEKRPCSRRQSTRSKDAEQERANDSFVKPVQTEEEIFKCRSARLKAEEQEPSDLMFEKTDALDPPADNDSFVKPVRTKEKIFKSRLKAEEQDPPDLMFEETDALDPHADKPVEAEKKINERQSTRSKAAEQETGNASFQISDGLDPIVAKSVEAKNKDKSQQRNEGKRVARKQKLLANEKATVVHLASAKFKSTNPFFMSVMQPSYVHSDNKMTIPKSFAMKYFERNNSNAILKVLDGRSWCVRYYIPYGINRIGTAKITHGWRVFAVENELEVGDVCAFELIKGKTTTLKVSIFRSKKAEKLEQAENQLAHSRFGPLIAPPQRKKEEESQLTK